MSKAIKLRVKKADGDHDLGVSKFLGSPVFPEEWLSDFSDTVMFLLQLNLEQIKDFDKDNLLPHKGYLYIFLDTANGCYNLKPIIRYFEGEPIHVIDNFNEIVPEYEEYVDEYLIEFEKGKEDMEGTKLFGTPSFWNYEDEPGTLFLQLDPLDPDMGLFRSFDGIMYFFFDKNSPKDYEKISLIEDFS